MFSRGGGDYTYVGNVTSWLGNDYLCSYCGAGLGTLIVGLILMPSRIIGCLKVEWAKHVHDLLPPQIVALPYLHETLSPCIDAVYSDHKICELDPEQLKQSNK